jgi:hypothetical protein
LAACYFASSLLAFIHSSIISRRLVVL